MAHFATHTLTTFPFKDWLFVLTLALNVAHPGFFNNIARQSRTKRKVNLEFIACAEGQWFVLHNDRAVF